MKTINTTTVCSVLACLCSPNTIAGLEELRYQSHQQVSVTKNTDDIGVENISTATLAISSGLDRIVSYKLYYNGALVSTQQTGVVGVEDRFTLGNKDFYGKIVDVQHNFGQGNYSVLIETHRLNGDLSSSETWEWINDLTAPVFNDEIKHTRRAYYATLERMGNSSTTEQLSVSVTDNDAIESAVYWTERNGDRREAVVSYNPDTSTAVASRNIVTSRALVPVDGEYRLGFDIYDKAGNKSTISRTSWIALSCHNAQVQRQVFNPTTSTWTDYEAGMTIYANPVKVRFARPLANFATEQNPLGWKIGHIITNSDSQNAYYERTFNYPGQYSYFHLYSENGFICYTHHDRSFSFVLADGVFEAPKGVQVSYQKDNINQWIGTTFPNTSSRLNEPYRISGYKFKVQLRPFRQLASINNIGSCYIEVGQDECVITNQNSPIVRSSGKGYVAHAWYLGHENGSLRNHQGYHLEYFDFNPPEIRTAEYEPSTKLLKSVTYNADTVTDWRQGIWQLSGVTAKALINGTWTELPRASEKYLDVWTFERYFDLSNLEVEGDIELKVEAWDNFGNRTESSFTVFVDNKAPTLTVEYQGAALPPIIESIEDLLISVTDSSNADLISARLMGSNSNEDVFLAIVEAGDAQFTLQTPRIFPTLDFELGEVYELELSARDSHGTQSLKTVSFGYTPANLIRMEIAPLLPVRAALRDRGDNPLVTIRAQDQLVLDNGQVATGIQEASITNRSNSDFAITIRSNTQEIEVPRGETKTLQVDLGNAGEILNVDVYPAESNKEGIAEFLFEIPQLKSIY